MCVRALTTPYPHMKSTVRHWASRSRSRRVKEMSVEIDLAKKDHYKYARQFTAAHGLASHTSCLHPTTGPSASRKLTC